MILGYSQEYGIEPALVFAIAETESNFNPQARSKVGAMGIMQIMPKTGEWIAACLSVENYKSEDLYIANTNLRFGIFYLSYLFTIFDEEWQVTAAYNAGEGTVKRWLAEGRKKETIPIAETARYVEKVEAALLRYRRKKFAAFD